MGSRANLILADENSYKLFYCHWCANSICNDIFCGPEFAIPYILRQARTNDWLDDIWAEGCLVIDTYQQVVLLCGSEDIDNNIPKRRLFLELMREVWTGWDIRWAHGGIFDQAAYLDVPLSVVTGVRKQAETPITAESFLPLPQKNRMDTVVSIVFEDGSLRLYPITPFRLSPFLEVGPSLLDLVSKNTGFEHFNIAEWTHEMPDAGLHIDVPRRQILYWAAHQGNLSQDFTRFWPGWELTWLCDKFERQIAETRGLLTFPIPAPDVLLHDLQERLVWNNPRSAAEIVDGTTQALKNAGHNVEPNPAAYLSEPQDISGAIRQQIVDNAVAAWRRRHGLT
jgi:hypothetical protein